MCEQCMWSAWAQPPIDVREGNDFNLKSSPICLSSSRPMEKSYIGHSPNSDADYQQVKAILWSARIESFVIDEVFKVKPHLVVEKHEWPNLRRHIHPGTAAEAQIYCPYFNTYSKSTHSDHYIVKGMCYHLTKVNNIGITQKLTTNIRTWAKVDEYIIVNSKKDRIYFMNIHDEDSRCSTQLGYGQCYLDDIAVKWYFSRFLVYDTTYL